MNNQDLYLSTKPSKLFMKAALPGAISMLASSLYSIFDSILVGKVLGTTAFAALGLSLPLVIVNFALADLIGVGSAVPISILLGKKEDKKANNYFTCATIMIIFTGLLMGILFYFISPIFMNFIGAEGELAKLGVKYIRVYAIFSPLITMTFALDNYLRICGKIKTSMILNVFISISTIFLELFFLLGLNMDIEGAALGTSLSMFIGTIIGLSMFMRGKLQLKFQKPEFNKKLIKDILKNGSPNFLSNVSGRIFSVIMNIMLMKLGGEQAVAVYGILMTVGGTAEQILYGILDSLQPAIGYNYGAAKFGRVKLIEKYCLISSSIVSIIFAMMMFSIPKPFAVLFLEDMSLLGLAEHALRLCSIAYLFKWISQAIQGFFLAIEQYIPAMYISLSNAFVVPTILIAVFYPLGLDGLWLNYSGTSFFTAILAVILMWKMKNKLFIVVENPVNNQ